MVRCFSFTATLDWYYRYSFSKAGRFTATLDWYYRYSFSKAGLRSTTTDLGDTVMHVWAPKAHIQSKPTLVLLHGLGANAMWQWNDFISPLMSLFNVYTPDLLFFRNSYTIRPERSEQFQAQCVMRVMEAHGVTVMSVVGISYGGFVGYSMAAQFKERVEKLVLCCAGVCMEEKDMEEGMFKVKTVDEAVSILLAQTPDKMRELMKFIFYKPPKGIPSFLLNDFIHVMCTEHFQERKELLQALHKDRKLSDLPKITQPTRIIWGEHDQIFPLELGHRLKRHLGDNAELVIVKNAGHVINAENSKELGENLKSFLIDPLPPS